MIAPAKTGRERSKRNAVINTDHLNKGSNSNCRGSIHKLIEVVIKLIAPRMELIPAKCREKITKSTLKPE